MAIYHFVERIALADAGECGWRVRIVIDTDLMTPVLTERFG
jgi:hypothetical protein